LVTAESLRFEIVYARDRRDCDTIPASHIPSVPGD